MTQQTLAILLEKLLADRAKLAIGEAIASTHAGSVGTFQTASGKTIVARALNFCTGGVLLAKVENEWVAIATHSENQQIVRSRIDRFEQRKANQAAVFGDFLVVRSIADFTPINGISSPFALNPYRFIAASNLKTLELKSTRQQYQFNYPYLNNYPESSLLPHYEYLPLSIDEGAPQGAYYRKIYQDPVSLGLTIIESFVSKEFLLNFLAEKSYRYLIVGLDIEFSFDFFNFPRPNYITISSTPPYPVTCDDYQFQLDGAAASPDGSYLVNLLDKLRVAFYETQEDAETNEPTESFSLDEFPIESTPYPARSIRGFAHGFANPIQVNLTSAVNFASASTLQSYATSSRSIRVQAAIEFDAQADPQLIEPRVVPVVTQIPLVRKFDSSGGEIESPVPPIYYLPYQQLSP